MSISVTKQEKLISILREMFQFDQADLDFGIYRIMAMKRDEVEKFLSVDLPKQIQESLQALNSVNNDGELAKIDEKIKQTKSLFADDADTLKVHLTKLEAQKNALQAQDIDIASLENDIYSHLTNFFSRYYDTGDFISQRRYKEGVYAIPYEGEEVKLHWANADQYYIKTSENFKDYTFKSSDGQNLVHFKLVEAETEQNNNKGKEKRLFQLHHEKPFEVENNAFTIYLEFKAVANSEKQEKYSTELVDYISETLNTSPAYLPFLWILEKVKSPNTKKEAKSLLETHLNKYTAKNSFDYFIHKDLGTFLNRELDFYIKNDVVFLDDIDEQDDAKTKAYLSKARTIRKIAKKLITFLAQIEDFQKSLWLKKKFVVESNYCITLDKIDEKFYTEIANNAAQHEEWIKLFAINEIQGDEIQGMMGACDYSNPLSVEFLKNNSFLVLDTAFFSAEFKEKLLESIDNLDEQTDGLLIHSENFQALNLLQEKYREQVKCIFVDPPYNTEDTEGENEFNYKDNYKSSSWLSLIYDRFFAGYGLLKSTGIQASTISDTELLSLIHCYNKIFDEYNRIGLVEWNSTKSVTNTALISMGHTHIPIYAKNKDYFIKNRSEFRLSDSEEGFKNPDNDTRGKWKADPFQVGGVRPNQLYEIKNPNTGVVYIPNEGCSWKNDYSTFLELLKENRIVFGVSGEAGPQRKRFWSEAEERGKVAKTWWEDLETTTNGTQQLKNYFIVCPFKNPKPVALLERYLMLSTQQNSLILDYFAGSGTTAHAVINLNREDEGKRKYILVEMGEYFDTVTKPRIQKVIYSDEWKSGKPLSRKGSSHIMKYIRLESYEDTLNNIVLEKNDLFSSILQEEYMLSYMLSMESKKSVLNIEQFRKPFSYTMGITRKQEKKETCIDLVETFNYLIGLYVVQNSAIQSYDANFTTSETGALSAELKTGSAYKIKMIEGQNLKRENILIIWREMTDNAGKSEEEIRKNIQKDNAVLDAFFAKKKISSTDFEYNKIYVNCDNNLPNLRSEEESWRVVLIEEEFKKRMFEGV